MLGSSVFLGNNIANFRLDLSAEVRNGPFFTRVSGKEIEAAIHFALGLDQ